VSNVIRQNFGSISIRIDRNHNDLYIVGFATSNFKKVAEIIGEMGGVPDGVDMDALADDLKEVYGPLLTKSFSEVNYANVILGGLRNVDNMLLIRSWLGTMGAVPIQRFSAAQYEEFLDLFLPTSMLGS